MKRRILSIWFSAGLAVLAQGQTMPEYRNMSTVVSAPQVDATSFINGGWFDLTWDSVGTGLDDYAGFETPANYAFRTENTLNYLNLASGYMADTYGFIFRFETNGIPLAAQRFDNQGEINGLFLSVNATNIINTGFLIADGGGMVRLEGQNVNLYRGGISTVGYNVGDHPSIYPSDGSELVYYGMDTNSIRDLSTVFNFSSNAAPSTPSHVVYDGGSNPGGFGGSQITLPIYNTRSNWTAFVYTNAPTPSNWIVQTIYVATNMWVSNLDLKAGFQRGFGSDFASGVVQLAAPVWDAVRGTNVTYYFTVVDRSPSLGTNDFLTNSAGNIIGVDGIRFYRTTAPFRADLQTNAVYTNTLIYDSATYSNKLVTNTWLAYSANVGPVVSNNSSGTYSFWRSNMFVNPGAGGLASVTNYPARVEIEAGNLDLTEARIRADRYLSIRATNLISATNALLDAPYMRLELGDNRSDIVMSGMVTPTISRLYGTFAVYSTVWTNQSGMVDAGGNTNTVDIAFHVLYVDYKFFNDWPVEYESLILHGRNIVMNDNASVQNKVLFDTENLKVGGTLQGDGFTNWSRAIAPRMLNFTNEGKITMVAKGDFGTDGGQPYNYFINSNPNTNNLPALKVDPAVFTSLTDIYEFVATNQLAFLVASPLKINAGEVRNTRGLLYAGDGDMEITSKVAKLDDSVLLAAGDLGLNISEAKVRNTSVFAGGMLNLNVPYLLSDGGPDSGKTNIWIATYGVNMMQKPYLGDLLSTEMRITSYRFADLTNRWAGFDYGPIERGYSNNAALGKLVLTNDYRARIGFMRPLNSQLYGRNALYVDRLELYSFDTNVSSLNIGSDMTVYFADSNISPDLLNGKVNGRLVWVPSYAGTFSRTNYTLPGGKIIQVNRALLASSVIDSDGDGTVNSRDTNVFSGVKFTEAYLTNNPPNTTVMSWKAAAQTIYQVDYTTDPIKPSWQSLLTVTNTATTNAILTIQDTVTAKSAQRFYRVTYAP